MLIQSILSRFFRTCCVAGLVSLMGVSAATAQQQMPPDITSQQGMSNIEQKLRQQGQHDAADKLRQMTPEQRQRVMDQVKMVYGMMQNMSPQQQQQMLGQMQQTSNSYAAKLDMNDPDKTMQGLQGLEKMLKSAEAQMEKMMRQKQHYEGSSMPSHPPTIAVPGNQQPRVNSRSISQDRGVEYRGH